MTKELSDKEVDYILGYTGMDIVLGLPVARTPVICFSRNDNVLEFVTMFSGELNKI